MIDCGDPFHDGDADGIVYEVPLANGWVAQGYECPTCGFRTFTSGTYIPESKPCPQCGQVFDGLPDDPDEVCDACATVNVDAWIAKELAARARPSVD